MKNYVTHPDELNAFMDNKIKIFTGTPSEVEKQIQELMESRPLIITDILQSESRTAHSHSITVTVFYEVEGQPRFMDKNLTMSGFASAIVDYLEKEHGLDYFKLLELIDIAKKEKQ